MASASVTLPGGIGGSINTDLGSTSHSYGVNSGFGWSSTMGTGKEVSEFNRHMMLEQQEYNAKEAEKARQWQKEMSDTAYQRAVADMKKAGINPILAFSGGGMSAASTPSGAFGQSGMATGATDSYSENYNYGMNSAHSYDNFYELMKGMGKGLKDLLSGLGDAFSRGSNPATTNPANAPSSSAVGSGNLSKEPPGLDYGHSQIPSYAAGSGVKPSGSGSNSAKGTWSGPGSNWTNGYGRNPGLMWR